MVVKELFAKLGMDVDAASFAAAGLAVEGVKKGLELLRDGLSEAVHGFVEIFAKTTEFASQINDMSARVGVGTEALQELRYMAKLNGMGFEEMAQGARFLGHNMASAASGSEETGKAFRELGIKVTDAHGKLRPVSDVMDDAAEAMAKMPDGAKKTQLAMAIFGRSGAAMIPMLNEGREGFEKMRAEAREFGIVLDKETIKAGDDLGDNMDRLGFVLEGLRNQIGGPLLKDLNDIAVAVLEWVKANQGLIHQRLRQVVDFIRVAIHAAGVVIKAAASATAMLARNLDVLAGILISRVLAAVLLNSGAIAYQTLLWIANGAAAVSAGYKAMVAWLKAVAPLAIVAAGLFVIYAALEDLYYAFTGGESVFGDFWASIMDTDTIWALKQFFAGVKNYFSAAVEGWKLALSEFFGWVVPKLKSIPGLGWVMDKLSSSGGSSSDASKGSATPPPAAPAAWQPPDFSTGALFGGGASPAASAAVNQSNRSLVYQPQVSLQQTINAAPGQSPKDVAQASTRAQGELLQQHLNEAYEAVQR